VDNLLPSEFTVDVNVDWLVGDQKEITCVVRFAGYINLEIYFMKE